MDRRWSQGISEVLRETSEICWLNNRLLFSFLLFSILLSSLIYIPSGFSVRPFLTDMLAKASLLSVITPCMPGFPSLSFGILKHLRFLSIIQLTYTVIHFLASVLITKAVIHASAFTHCKKRVSLKELVLLTLRSCRKALITYLHISLFVLGYNFLLYLIFYPVDLFTVLPAILAMALQPYLAVEWNLALVISIVDEIFGIEALGIASKIVKDVRLQGFLLNFSLALLHWLLWLGVTLINVGMSITQDIVVLLLVGFISMVNLLLLVAYTLLFFGCKNTHGDEVQMVVSSDYENLPDDSHVDDPIP